MEAVVLHRVGLLEYFCPKQGQDFKPSAAPIYPNMGKVRSPQRPRALCTLRQSKNLNLLNLHAPNFVCVFQYFTIRTHYRKRRQIFPDK